MNKYELTVVVNAKIEDDVRVATVEKVKEYVARYGGTVTNVDEWGKKRLAYEIQKMKEGFYYFIQFEADATAPAEIERHVRISCVAFGRSAEFAEKYFHQGLKVVVTGRIQTGSYTNRDGNKVYTTDVVVEDQEFAESKAASQANGNNYTPARPEPSAASGDGFMNIPDGIDEELPFN